MTERRRNAGFTLVEVLVGATLLAIVMTLLANALFTMTRSARAGEARLEEIDSRELVHAFLRRQLQAAFPLTERDGDGGRVLFDGRDARLRFVGHLPIAEGGGLQFIELGVSRGDLTMRYRDAWPDTPFTEPDSSWSSRSLLSGVRRVRWRYFGAPNNDPVARWTDEWRGRDRLPELIRVELERGGETTTLAAEVRVQTAVAQPALFRERPDGTRP
jgi:general secretion pathway protein J